MTKAAARQTGSRAFDPRLLRAARTTRRHLVVAVALGAVTAGLVVAQAWLISTTVAGAFVHHRDLAQLRTSVAALLAVVLARAAVGWTSERAAARASARAKSELRLALARRLARPAPQRPAADHSGPLVMLATNGVDALDGYFSLYLPQVLLAVIVPVVVLAVIVGRDWLSAVIIAATLPLIPLFMALVGQATAARTRRQVATLHRLANHFLDVVAGLPTLRVFGRARAQATAIRDITDRYRRTTLATLRVAFLSAMILELLATYSVALVAVAVGLRLLAGHLDLQTALFVLVLAPEAYLPLRQLGVNYHASTEGMEAAGQILDLLDEPQPAAGTRRDVPDPSWSAIHVNGLGVVYPQRTQPALARVELNVQPGETLALAGPSGCGKSTLLGVLLGFVAPTAGSVTVGGIDLAELDPDEWRRRLAWVPQRPHLFAASVADNIRLGRPGAPLGDVLAAARQAGLEDVLLRLADGLDTPLGENGAGLSAGERQRVALARAFLRDAPLVLLDEPTANLDGDTEEAVLAAVRRLTEARTVVIAAHRPALLALADRVVDLAPAAVAP